MREAVAGGDLASFRARLRERYTNGDVGGDPAAGATDAAAPARGDDDS